MPNTPDAEAQNRCRKCGSPACLALVRATTPPVNVIDLIDRQFKLMSSGHWSWDHVGYFVVVAAVVAVVAILCAIASPGWTLAISGGLVSTAAGLGLLRRRRRARQALAEPTAPEDI
ncbi:hypothetical protein [Nocardia asteroides]|uniref:hypothetical protein n=1 Tax=Nocardia asteroides TaxID=1824 RepID=UPI00340F8BE5